MSKYIIDTDQFEKLFETKAVAVLGISDNLAVPEEGEKTVWARMLNVADLEELNSDYINEHYGSLQDDAYQKGFEDGKAQSKRGCEGCKYECENKRRVPCILCSDNIKLPSTISPSKLKSQWTAKGCEGCKYQANRELTCPCSECANNYKNQWTAKSPIDDGFVRGDVVVDENGIKGIVVSSDNDEDSYFYVLYDECQVPQRVTQRYYKKTGEHYDIDKYFKEINRSKTDDLC